MINKYSAHPDLASRQLDRSDSTQPIKKPSKFTQHRRNKSSTNTTTKSFKDTADNNSLVKQLSTNSLFIRAKSPNKTKKLAHNINNNLDVESEIGVGADLEVDGKNVHHYDNDNSESADNPVKSKVTNSLKHNKSQNSITIQCSNNFPKVIHDANISDHSIIETTKLSSTPLPSSSSTNKPGVTKDCNKSTATVTPAAAKNCISISYLNRISCNFSKHNIESDSIPIPITSAIVTGLETVSSRSEPLVVSSSNLPSERKNLNTSNSATTNTTTTSTLTSTSASALTRLSTQDPDTDLDLKNLSKDETDHVHNRFYQGSINSNLSLFEDNEYLQQHHQQQHHLHQQHHHECNEKLQDLPVGSFAMNSLADVACSSDVSSTLSSAVPSTVSSPLSSPNRLPQQLHHVHKHCCHKVITETLNNAEDSVQQNHPNARLHHHHHHHHHQHHHQHTPSTSQNTSASSASISGNTPIPSGCKKWQKFDPRLGPSPYRQLLPIALCMISFAAVFAILIIYMDTTEIRHQQFRLKMSRDDEFSGVAQDDPALIAFLRQIHLRKYPMHFPKTSDTQSSSSSLSSSSSSSISNSGSGIGLGIGSGSSSISSSNNVVDQHLNLSAHHDELMLAMAYYVANLVGNNPNGAAIQSMTGSVGQLLMAPWFSGNLNWMTVIVEPEPRRYFRLRKQNADRPKLQVVHACVSPSPYPKEVTIHYEHDDVRINRIHDQETSWFNSRVKCFPLYTIMLTYDRVEYDLLSLGVRGHELEILQTLPFERIQIKVISIHLPEDHTDIRNYIQLIEEFLAGKSYKLQKKFGRNYFYQRLDFSTIRTRKKDIFLLKTP